MPLIERIKKYFGAGDASPKNSFPPPTSASDITAFLIARLGARVKMRPGEVLTEQTPFEDLGINSLVLVKFSLELEEWLNVEVEPTLVTEHSNIRELALALDKLRVDGCRSQNVQ